MYIKSILTMFGVKLEFASNKRAAAPATIGADIDVPLRYISFMLVVEYLLVSSSGYFLTRPLPTACGGDDLVTRGNEIRFDEVVVVYQAVRID